jgi:hypothetical protein
MNYILSNDNEYMDIEGDDTPTQDIRRGTKRSYIDMYGPLRKIKVEVPIKTAKN